MFNFYLLVFFFIPEDIIVLTNKFTIYSENFLAGRGGALGSVDPLIIRSQEQAKVQFCQMSPWGTNWFIGLTLHEWGLLTGVWALAPKSSHTGKSLPSMNNGFPIAALVSVSPTPSLSQPVYSSSSTISWGHMCLEQNCTQLAEREAIFSGEDQRLSSSTLLWRSINSQEAREAHLLETGTVDLLKMAVVWLCSTPFIKESHIHRIM